MKFKAVTRPRKNKAGEVPIYIRISDANKDRYISLGIHIKPQFWNKRSGTVRQNDYYDADAINALITRKLSEVRLQFYQLRQTNDTVSANTVKNNVSYDSGDFLVYAKSYADRFKSAGKIGTYRRYNSIISKIETFHGEKLPFSEITWPWLEAYEKWCYTKEISNNYNTVHSNFRVIRTILYAAARDKLIKAEDNPFLHHKLKEPKTQRDKLTIDEIKAIEDLVLQKNSLIWHVRNYFLFSFYCGGIRFGDVVRLTWKNIEDGHLKFTMSKTGDPISIKILDKSYAILGLYRGDELDPDTFIFPILDTSKKLSDPETLVTEIGSKNTLVNQYLKKIAKAANISKKISFHIARHSAADFFRKRGVSVYSIQHILGHKNVQVTQRYLKALDGEFTDKEMEKAFGNGVGDKSN